MAGVTDGLRAEVDRLVAAAVAEQQAPGVVAAVADEEQVHVALAGEATVGGPAMRRDTLFRITSMTRPMTAAVVLSLIEDGLMELDQPVEQVLPELADRRVLRRPDGALDDTEPAVRPFTVRDLLTFTWGMGMQGAMLAAPEPWPVVLAAEQRELGAFGPPQPARIPDPDTWLARLAELPLLAQPGERWLYHTGSLVLSVLAGRIAGAPFEDVLRGRLFEPLRMGGAAFHADQADRLTTAYVRTDGALTVRDPPDGQWSRPPRFADGGGGLLAAVDDVVAFGQMLLRRGAPVLGPETVAEMTRDQLSPGQRANVWPGFSFLGDRGWGYGLSVRADGSYGWEGGFGTTWVNLPAQAVCVVVLTQRAADHTGLPAVCEQIVQAALAQPSR